jgi:hypothetical protein
VRKSKSKASGAEWCLPIDDNAWVEVSFGSSSREAFMQCLRVMGAAALSLGLFSVPAWGAATPSITPVGTVIAADRAHVGQTSADVGTTVYGGDRISTDAQGNMQLRAGAARLLLLSSSSAIVDDSDGAPSARLVMGTATFSTGNAHAFTLFASKAAIRAQTDAPTIGQVTYLSEKDLLVTSRRGGLTVTVENETQVVPEGSSFHVLLDPAAESQGPAGAGTENKKQKGSNTGPLKAGRSRFLIVAVGATGIATYFALSEALESPARP